ncbi:Putative transcriptional regulator [Ignavibacterium album JCM 16511]|uniref:Putative transcriptional regulator n=1 Tax=Ignavibacterium album (strain DSM 19864 / JCM 16511 / NBRC 101810 / Mat9-16) TaxID=945713 RepID=I0AGD6_IGNAJ|nr:helix-turn-helix domain-containing protein [Ignavibacterium album]AFH48043.1 Putative transcriptional regulator [Ignavibacterium album JCM 16511]
MKIRVIKNKKDYEVALKTIDELWNSKPNTEEGDLLELLLTLVEVYEQKHYKISPPDPIEAIKFRMEQLGLKQSDIADVIGGKNRVSEILNRKRELTAKMMRDLHKKFNIPAESLLS